MYIEQIFFYYLLLIFLLNNFNIFIAGCDWLYQDFTCVSKPEGCILASPGFPGLYPSHVTCRYHITMSSLRTKVKIIFITLSLPHK